MSGLFDPCGYCCLRLPGGFLMVIDQFQAYGGRGYRITKAAEKYLAQAGMEVIPTEEYYERFDRLVFRVSPWEGHTDEEGRALFCRHNTAETRDSPGPGTISSER